MALFFFFCLSATSCGEGRVFGVPLGEAREKLSRADISFVLRVSPRRYAEAFRLGAEGPWVIAMHLEAQGHVDKALDWYGWASVKSSEPYATLCVEGLSRVGSDQQRLKALSILDDMGDYSIASVPALREERERMRNLVLLQSGRYAELPGGVSSWICEADLDASYVGLLASIAREDPVASLRSAMLEKQYQRSWEYVQQLFDSAGERAYYRRVLSDSGRSALFGSPSAKAASDFFVSLLPGIPQGDSFADAPYMISFYAARLLSREGKEHRDAARELFDRAIRTAQNSRDRDVAIWYLLDQSLAERTSLCLDDIERYGPQWSDGSYYADILERLTMSIIRDRSWSSLERLSHILPDATDRDSRARVDYLSARLAPIPAEEKTLALRRAWEGDHDSLYYRVLAADALGLPLGEEQLPVAGRGVPREDANAASRAASVLAVLESMVRYGLYDRVYPFARERAGDIGLYATSMEVHRLADALSAAGFYSEALRLSVLAFRSSSGSISNEDLAYIYPRPHQGFVATAAERFGIPEYLLYALLRSESFFNEKVVSHAGAMGLAQLMEPTARDIARKLKVETWDLLDPATNITFGAYYLSELIYRLDGRVMSALFAYNAGISRVRTWEREGKDLPDDAFAESLPFTETREYGRKVLAAAAVYGYLYYNVSPGQVVRDIF